MLAQLVAQLRGHAAVATIVLLDLAHPLLHPFEGGALDPLLVWLNATAAQALEP